MTKHVAIPETMRAVVLDGIGLDHVTVRDVPTPLPRSREALARVDGAGICTSLIKIAEQGPAHTNLYGWDVGRYPIILGDEGSITLVKVGAAVDGQLRVGDRFAVQPSVYHPPIRHRERYRDEGRGIDKLGVGYTLPGHLAEYMIVGEEMIAAGCLLPLPDSSLPHAHVVLSEPFSCVVSAQEHHIHLSQEHLAAPRRAIKGLKRGGVTLIIGAGAMGRMHIDLALSSGPRAVIVSDFLEERRARARELFEIRANELGIIFRLVDPGAGDLGRIVNHVSDRRGADDVIGAVGSSAAIESAQQYVARGGVLNLFGGFTAGETTVRLDGNHIHYRETMVTGSSGGVAWDVSHTLELMASGDIDPSVQITRICDLDHVPEILEMIRRRELDGKAVVYPHRKAGTILAVDRWSGMDEATFLGVDP